MKILVACEESQAVTKELRRHLLTPQQYRTIKGQILAGETDGALRGLQKLTKGWKKA